MLRPAFRTAVLTILMAMPASGTQAEERLEPRFAPTSPWELDYARDSCSLARKFEHESSPVLLRMRRYGPGRALEITIAGPDLETRRTAPRLSFSPFEAKEFPLASRATYPNGWKGLIVSTSIDEETDGSHPPPNLVFTDDFDRASAIEMIRVEGFDEPLALLTGPLDQPLKAMSTCIVELLSHWDIDVEAHQTLQRAVRPVDQERWATEVQKKYPASAVRNSKGARIAVRLNVGEDGKPTACTTQAPADPVFSKPLCKTLLRVARFDPALDKEGEPLASFYVFNVLYSVH